MLVGGEGDGTELVDEDVVGAIVGIVVSFVTVCVGV